jgi:hypothetical protein
MVWNTTTRVTFALLVVSALSVGGVGFFMNGIRDELVFKHSRARAEAAVMDVAARERAFRLTKGRFDVFKPSEAAVHLRRMGMSLADWPTDDFLFDASLMPNSHLRIRALPRPEAVEELRVGARMFVADVTASGVSQSRWYP